MSSRTKSFFEQDHRNKSRSGHWQHQQSRPVLSETSVNVQKTKPPIPATSQARAKLKNFQFVEASNGAQDAPKAITQVQESMPSAELGRQPPIEQSHGPVESKDQRVESTLFNPAAPQARQKSEKTPETDSIAQFPCTPCARLPLEDLIGNFETADKPEPQKQSPEEHLGWMPNSSAQLITPNLRKRKRARSSSPSCPSTSQRHDTSSRLNGSSPPLERQALDADPAIDLWQRYGAKQGDVGTRLPDFTHLMCQDSPHMLETPVKSAGLRRWASTGNDWPSSKTKRQRTSGPSHVAIWQAEQPSEANGKSRVATMIERLQESLAMQRIAQAEKATALHSEGPSSSDPLPGAGNDGQKSNILSPLGAKRLLVPTRAKLLKATSDPMPAMARQTDVSSDDSPFNDGPTSYTMRQNEDPGSGAGVILAALHAQCKVPLPAYKRLSLKSTTKNDQSQNPGAQPVCEVSKPQTKQLSDDDLDEFSNGFDLSAEDLDELMEIGQKVNTPQPTTAPSLSNKNGPTMPPVAPVLPRSNNISNQPILLDDDDDEFACDEVDDDLFAQAEVSAAQTHRISPHKNGQRTGPLRLYEACSQSPGERSPNSLSRYTIKQIVHGEYSTDKGATRSEVLLLAQNERSSLPVAITLRDSWITTDVAVGDILHLVSVHRASSGSIQQNTPPGQLLISDSEDSSMIIIHPDHMLSATTVADSFDCIRKAVLADRVKATSDTNKATVYGKILHEVVQQALICNRWEDSFLSTLVEKTVLNHLTGLWEIGMQDTVLAIEEIRAKMTELAGWARVFVTNKPNQNSIVENKQGDSLSMAISKLIAVEEHIWSPYYGLKGNIDATIEATVSSYSQESPQRLIMPFEIKTGRASHSSSHRAQTALYTLLLSDRYEVAVKAGILYYLEGSAMSHVSPPLVEMRQMLQQRNRLASSIHRARHPNKTPGSAELDPNERDMPRRGLPAMLKNPIKCGRCYAQQSCFTFHALIENGSSVSAGMVDDDKKNYSAIWHEAVGHLRLGAKDKNDAEKLKKWLAHWDTLLTLEESDASRFSKEIWTMTSAEREAIGRCFGGVVISEDLTTTSDPDLNQATSTSDEVVTSGGRINRFSYKFVRANSTINASFTEGSQLVLGEPIVISLESGQWALANGYITAITKRYITVAVDRKLGSSRTRLDDFDEQSNQVFRGIMTVGKIATANPANHARIVYRIDKDEFSNGLAMVRNNLFTLVSTHPIHTKLRQQIVLGKPPEFEARSTADSPSLSQLGAMNTDQRAAVEKVLSAKDYALVLGMPGTGKTTTIAHLISALLAEEKTILLAAYTHTAVDNILLKIQHIVPPNSIIRLGVPAKINKQVQTFCQLATTPRGSIDEIEEAFMGSRIVATTCMGTNHALFNRRAFDVCIIDEASQITMPTSLGPLLHARKFVLVGDHYQLPPLVQNRMALEGGLDISLFRQISEMHPQAVAALSEQYRMCEQIMSLSNALIYGGKLRCGSESVAQRILRGLNLHALSAFHGAEWSCSKFLSQSRCWLHRTIAPEHKVVYLNTDLNGSSGLETLTTGKNITNHLEAAISVQLVLSLLAVGVPVNEIGIITLYRSQLALIRQMFKTAGISSDVELDSADRFQGRDKECIILSMVRSNESGIVGELLKDWRRVNVAITRARSKLIVIGGRRTLKNNDLLAKFFDLVDSNGWGFDLPADATGNHNFGSALQLTNGSVTSAQSSTPKESSPSIPGEDPSKIGEKLNKSQENICKNRTSQQSTKGSPLKSMSNTKTANKIIKGTAIAKSKARRIKEQLAVEIFEDFTADEIM